jgi:hypothetical protein
MGLLLLLGALGLEGVVGLFDPLALGLDSITQRTGHIQKGRRTTTNRNCTEHETDRQNGRRKSHPEKPKSATEQGVFPTPKKFPSSITQCVSSNKMGGMNSICQ